MKRGQELFNAASSQINGVKQDNYGAPEDCFEEIARRWTEYLQNRGIIIESVGLKGSGLKPSLTPADVAFLMMELKMVRESNKHQPDNLVDLVGYAGLMVDFVPPNAEGEKRIPQILCPTCLYFNKDDQETQPCTLRLSKAENCFRYSKHEEL